MAKIRNLIFSLFVVSMAIIPTLTLAVGTGGTGQSDPTTCTGGSCTLTNPLGDINSPQVLIGRVITSVLGVVGSLALLMFIYGGLTWMTSSGSAEKVKKGRDIILWSAVGLVVIFMSYALVRFVLSAIT